MNTNSTTRSRLTSVALVTGGLLAGAVLVGGVANAATSTPTPSSSTGSSTTAPAQGPGAGGHGGATPVRSDEKAVSGADAATLKAAALKAVPGATVYRVETDAGDAAYEVHLTKSDGTEATVKFDKDFALVKVETGMGQGDPAPTGAPSSTPASG
jgi:hypothetical protein